MLHILTEALRNSILITGLVVVMMMMIESLNIESRGMFFKGLRKTRTGQVLIGALLGSIPGCMGGFATVSLYTHRMLSFGALVAMMIASSGDESFIMLAMIPKTALIMFAVLFVLAIVVGIIVDKIYDRKHAQHCHKHDHDDCGVETDCEGFELHEHACEHGCEHESDTVISLANAQATSSITSEGKGRVEKSRHFGWKRICMFIGLAIFIAALATGRLGHDHSAHAGHDHSAHAEQTQTVQALTVQAEHVHSEACNHAGHSHDSHNHAGHNHAASCQQDHEAEGHSHAAHAGHDHSAASCEHGHSHDGFNLLSEDWMNVLFAGLSVIILFVLLFASDHFVNEHLWKHIICKHLPTIFAWTFGVLLVLGVALQYIDIKHWTSTNTALMILLATLVGIIPESGPHLIFLTLYASGAVSFPVLLASSISQDGHASIPLLAESKRSFIWAKLINCAVALLAGFTAMLFM